MSYKLFLDDERFPTTDDWEIVRNIYEFMGTIRVLGIPSHISFDHDLGENTPTGYEVVKEMIDFMMENDITFPDNFTYYVHSQNPVGKANIEGLMDNFIKVWVKDRPI